MRNRFQIAVPSKRVAVLATAFCLAACGSPIVESIDKLDGGPEEQAAGRHELVLAADEAIEPLIEALESGERDPKIRAEVATFWRA